MTEADLGEPFAHGGTASLHSLPDGRVLKVFADWVPEWLPGREAANARIAHELGVPSPRAWPVEDVGSRLAIPMERIDGGTLADHLFEHPEDVETDAARVAGIHRRMAGCRHDDLRDGESMADRMIGAADIEPSARAAVRARLEQLESGDTLCHGDFHAANVLRTAAGDLVVIDWGAAHAGAPARDATQTIVAMTEWLAADVPTSWKDVAERFITAYRAARTDVADAIEGWTPVVAAMRLGCPHPPTSEAPLRALVDRALD